jgi:hypothetical protein
MRQTDDRALTGSVLSGISSESICLVGLLWLLDQSIQSVATVFGHIVLKGSIRTVELWLALRIGMLRSANRDTRRRILTDATERRHVGPQVRAPVIGCGKFDSSIQNAILLERH